MSSALHDSLNYKHAGRTYSTTPYNLLKKVEINRNGNEFQHMVFTLNKKFLRSSAIGFDQFKKDTMGMAMLKAFSFYIKMCYEILGEENYIVENVGQVSQGVAVFLEWVKSATLDKYIGVRIHFFSAKKDRKADAFKTICKIIKQNALNAKKNSRLFLKNRMEHDCWETITTYNDYARQVADVYTNNHLASSAMSRDNIMSRTHEAHPLYVFNPSKGSHFILKGADPMQNDISNYQQGDTFMFPMMDRVYRMFPTDLHLDKFFRKYLPDYYFTKVIFPKAFFSTPIDDRVTMKLQEHMHVDRFAKLLCTLRQDGPNEWSFEFDRQTEIENALKSHFLILHVLDNDANAHREVSTETVSFVKATALSDADVLHEDSLTADASQIISPLLQTLLTDKHSLSDLDVLRIRSRYKQEWIIDRRAFQESMVEDFVERVWDDQHADVSKPAKMMLLWKDNIRKEEHTLFNFKRVDPDMSVFANRIIRLLQFYDKELFVSSAHKTLLLLHHSKYDAYRNECNLHFNQIYTGEGATSKSFLFEKMEQMSIEGTVETLSYQTTKADAVDGDLIDNIIVFNEAPPGMFMTNKNGDLQQEALFKEKLTSMRVSVKEFWRDENTGERKNRIAKSQSIGVCMGATNDDPSLCSEAMATRFYWGQFHKFEGLSRSIQVCMRGDRELKDCQEAVDEMNRMLCYCKEEQLRMWLVYKFMYMEILKKPTLKAADVVYDQMTLLLKTKYKVNIPPRTKERYEMLCTIFTIINALEIVFNVEGGIHSCKTQWVEVQKDMYDAHDGEKDISVSTETGVEVRKYYVEKRFPDQANDFHPMQILDIEEYLFCTEEIAIFAFTHISEEIVNPNEYKVLQAIWELHKKSNEYMEDIHTTDDGQKVCNTDFNYIRVNSGKRLLTEIINAIPAKAGKMSKHNISSLLTEWSERCIICPIYRDGSVPGNKEFNDAYPQPMDNRERKIQVIFSVKETYIHIDLFKGIRKRHYTNVMKEAIKALEHKYAYPHRKFLLGSSIMEMGIVKHPHVLDTVSMNDDDKVLTLVNPLFRDDNDKKIKSLPSVSRKQKYTKNSISLDLTVYAAMHHLQTLGITDRLKSRAKGIVEYYARFPHASDIIDYPTSIIEQGIVDEASEEDSDDMDMIASLTTIRPSKRRRKY